jgi:hypothetical protein
MFAGHTMLLLLRRLAVSLLGLCRALLLLVLMLLVKPSSISMVI